MESFSGLHTENINENGIRGKWFSIDVPHIAEAKHDLGLFNRIKDFISVLSQRSNWCTRNPKVVGENYSGCTFHIFIDNKGLPQLCLVRNGEMFKDIRGNNQYEKLTTRYKELLKSFLKKHNLNNIKLNEIFSDSSISDLFK